MNEIIELFIAVPKPKNRKEKYRVNALGFLLTYGSLMVGGIVWLMFDWFYAVAFTLVSYLILGIIMSKLAQANVPWAQWEHRYNGFELAAWVLLLPAEYES